jgi:Bax protein
MSQNARSGIAGLSLPSFDRSAVGAVCAAVVGLYGAVLADALRSGQGSNAGGQNVLALPAAQQAEQGRQNLTALAAKTVKVRDVVTVPALPHLRPFGLKSAMTSLAGRSRTVAEPILVATTADLDSKFNQVGFDLSEVRDGAAVPRLTLVSLPRDLPDLRSVQARKNLFVRVILPLVLQANEDVHKDRARLLNLAARQGDLGQANRVWLLKLADTYGVEESDRRKLFAELKRRVDIVPPSLALAQGAEESGWGTSRFALEGNAVFGQWTYKQGQGIVPAQREAGKRHEIKAFSGLRNSIAAYVHNLNTHWAYVEFRTGRADARKGGGDLEGAMLIGTLHKYSQRGQDYIHTIKTIMRVNGFSVFDRARLQRLEGEET